MLAVKLQVSIAMLGQDKATFNTQFKSELQNLTEQTKYASETRIDQFQIFVSFYPGNVDAS
jgi:hypothetical protein